ncbi:MAG: RDD family protein [Solirubrobacterales bacterium]
MQYEDRITVSTPEGTDIEITLAGLGSRMLARMLDLFLGGLLALGVAVVIGLVLAAIGAPVGLAFATGAGFIFFVLLGYDVYFEVTRGGQTPGKRKLSVRVLDTEGGPVSVRASLARNALRLIDDFGTFFIAGTIAIARSARNQRLGDMAAGTLVVEVAGAGAAAAHRELTISLGAVRILERAEAWDTSAVGEEDLDAARALLERRSALAAADRGRLARKIGERIRTQLVGPEDDLDDEQLLEVVVALKARRGR